MKRRSCLFTASSSRFLNARKDASLGPSSIGYSFLACALLPFTTTAARIAASPHATRFVFVIVADLPQRHYSALKGQATSGAERTAPLDFDGLDDVVG